MSWSGSTNSVTAAELDVAVDNITITGPRSPKVDTQIAAAKSAAKTLFASGALGTEGHFRVSISGHAEPEFGGVSDHVSVYVFHTITPVS